MNNQVINLTPHSITLVGEGNAPILTIPASGQVARCKASTVSVGSISINGVIIPLTDTEMGDVTGLPEEQEGVLLIVSLAVAQACPDRHDLLITNESVRDDKGTIIGCRSLSPLGRR